MTNQEVVMIEIEIIDFDPDNPRFYRLSDTNSEDALVDEMFDHKGAQDFKSMESDPIDFLNAKK